MKITVRYFAIVREALGRSTEIREAPDGSTAGDLLALVTAEAPRLAGLGKSMMLMVNEEYVEPGVVLHDGDEFAIIPPVSGGAGARLFKITDRPINTAETEAVVSDPGAGAIVSFTGAVRNTARGRSVVALDYEAYPPAAEKMLAQIGGEIEEKWGIDRVAIVHRTGVLKPGETSVVISVASAHRGEAFEAARFAIERIKEIVPIWKKEHYEDGAVWVGSEFDYQRETGRIP